MRSIKRIEDTYPYKISTRLLMQKALKEGYSINYFPSSPSTMSGVTRCEKNGKEFFFKGTCAALTPAYGVYAAENKCLTHSMLTAQGINTPEITVLAPQDPVAPALDMLKKYSSVVVKPSKMNHGDGVTVNVKSRDSLLVAIEYARQAGGQNSDVIVQQQVAGEEYRFLVLSGKVIAIARRRPPFVTGDGSSTIEELIRLKNQDPRRGEGHTKELTAIDIEDVSRHRGSDFLNRVLAKGEVVQVLDTSNLSRGGESEDFTDRASAELKKMAVSAAQSCFLGIAGVDIITTDIGSSSLENSYVIEVNLSPGVRMHQFPSIGKSRDVVAKIFRAIEETATPAGRRMSYLGRAEKIHFPDLLLEGVYARIDTGAKTSALWASEAAEKNGILEVVFFGPGSPFYTGKVTLFNEFGKTVVASSNGHVQTRYKVRLAVTLKGRKIRAWFTLADRSSQVYPVLIGRNVLLGKFMVDVQEGQILRAAERKRTEALRKKLSEAEE